MLRKYAFLTKFFLHITIHITTSIFQKHRTQKYVVFLEKNTNTFLPLGIKHKYGL